MKRMTFLTTIPALLLGIVMGVAFSPAYAVDDIDVFELDGNAIDSPTVLGDDWETLPGGEETAFTFITDKDQPEGDDIFTGGGSKTPNDPEDWLWKVSPPPPDKDNIYHAFAANYMYEVSEGVFDQIIYFGADLFAANGDAELGFWFFKSAVAKDPLGGFIGHHMDGDVYVAVKFSNGGTDANITVFEWYGDCDKAVKNPGAYDCAADNIRVVIPEEHAWCNGVGGNACAITNTANKQSPWTYVPKSGTPGYFPPTTFFEGGININAIFNDNKCFASFMATTGASTSFTSTAKDFALGDFDVCSVDVTKACFNDDNGDDTPTEIIYNVRGCAINDGGAPIYLTVYEEGDDAGYSDLLNAIGGVPKGTPDDLIWYIPEKVDDGSGLRDLTIEDCYETDVVLLDLLLKQAVDGASIVDDRGSTADLDTTDLAAGEILVYEFSEHVSANGPTDTVTLDAIGMDGAEIDADTATATCPLREFNASLSVTKQCSANLEDAGDNVVVVIDVAGQVCNTGEVPLTGLALFDDVDNAALGSVTLLPASTTLAAAGDPGECTGYTGYYYPSSIPTGNSCPFADVVKATAEAPVNTKYGAGTGCALVDKVVTIDDVETTIQVIECAAFSSPANCALRVSDALSCEIQVFGPPQE